MIVSWRLIKNKKCTSISRSRIFRWVEFSSASNSCLSFMARRAAYSKIGKFTKQDIMELCPSIGKSSVENALKQLIREGAIIRHGGGRSTYYTRRDAES